MVGDLEPYYEYIADSRHRAQIGLAAWSPDVLDPSGFFEPVLTCASFVPASSTNANYAGYCDRRTDFDIRRAESLAATEPGLANELWAALDRRIENASPWVPSTPCAGTTCSRPASATINNPMFGFLIDQAWVT